jgi:membrane-associated phospholipid phosphatase
LGEVAIVVGIYVAYLSAPAIFAPDSENLAINNALKVVSLEQTIGLFHEIRWQRWAMEAGRALVHFFNWVYILAYWPVMIPAAVVAYIKSRDWYHYYRNVLLMTCVVAIPAFVIFPVSPPRTFPAFVDTIQAFGPAIYGSREMAIYYNALASTPSLHFAWALIFGAMFLRSRRPWLKILGVLYPSLHFLSIIFTGNHYFLDAIGGFSLALSCLLLYKLYLRGRLYHQERRQARHAPAPQPA